MTYTEEQHKPQFDWNEFLGRKDLTEPEAAAARKISMSWITCACGNLCASLPRDHCGVPKDELLARLGERFGSHIVIIHQLVSVSEPWDNACNEAQKTLAKIEHRSNTLLKQQALANTINKEHPQIVMPLPCPFCGRPPKMEWNDSSGGCKVVRVIRCHNKKCHIMPSVRVAKLKAMRDADTRSKAMDQWNQRA